MRKLRAIIVMAVLLVAVAVPAIARAEEIRVSATPSLNTTFSGSFQAVPGVSGGSISFLVSKAGRIMEVTLKEWGFINFYCGGGKTISSSGSTTTYSWTDGLAITGGKFTISFSNFDWDGVFDSATSVHGHVRVGAFNCQNRPQSASWSAKAPVVVRPKATVSTPVAPTSARKNVTFAVSGYLRPQHPAGTYPVRIYKYRKVSGVWKSYGYVNAKASYYSTYTKYTASVKFPYAGSWRLRAYHADAGHAASWSAGYDYVTVK